MASWLDIINSYSGLLSVVLNVVMVVIWAVYLNLFFRNYIRNARTEVHIDIGAAKGHSARCLVTNMGSDTLYLEDVIAQLRFGDQVWRAVVTDRDEMDEGSVERPLSRTNRGPLPGGEIIDVGSFREMVERVRLQTGTEGLEHFDSMTVTVIGLTSQSHRFIAGEKIFTAQLCDKETRFHAESVRTRQWRLKHYKAADFVPEDYGE